MKFLDLRSDTLTKPSQKMRMVMAEAEVGDAFYDEDPSVRDLENTVSSLFGHEAALFVPSGTMSNQVALQVHCRQGEAILCAPDLHVVRAECGGLAALAGLQPVTPRLSEGFLPDVTGLDDSFVPRGSLVSPPTTLMVLENTHLFSGGRIHPFEHMKQLSAWCHEKRIPVHLDGARLWHAHVETGVPLKEFGALFTTLSVCFSKGLGAPVGSCLVGSAESIQKAKVIRKRLGGSMRQCGILAAAAKFALQNHLSALREDHLNARRLGSWLSSELTQAEIQTPETNIVLVRTKTPAIDVANQLKNNFGLVLSALGPQTLRAVCHRDISAADILALTTKTKIT
ncbi:MAG: L-allo-threonine aldolase [Pseudomonadota bacterium]